MRRSPILGPLLLGALAIGGCSERAPVLTEEYSRGEVASGWPPPAVYVDDAFHPANRWFQRSFAERRDDGRIVAARPEEPCSPLEDPLPVDRAEVAALLDALAAEPLPVRVDSVTRRVLRADLVEQATYWDRQPEAGELAEAHRRAAARVDAVADRTEDGRLVPPPLRRGDWSTPLPRTLPGELRAVVRYADGPGGTRRAVLALRRPEEELVAECWTLSVSVESIVGEVWRFDRALWRQGADPWVRRTGDDPVRIRDPRSGGRAALRGPVRELCRSCHPAEQPFLSPRSPRPDRP